MTKLLPLLLLVAGSGLLIATGFTIVGQRRDAWQDAAQESIRLFNEGPISDAVESSSSTLALAQKIYGEGNLKTALSEEYLARTQFASCDYAAAQASYSRALKIYERLYGVNHPFALYTTLGLTDAAGELGDFDRAERFSSAAIAAARAGAGEISPDAALVYSHIALLYSDWGRWQESAQIAKRALEIASRSNSSNAAERLSKLALCEVQTISSAASDSDAEGAKDNYCSAALTAISAAERADSPLRARALLAASRQKAAAKNIVDAAKQLQDAADLYARNSKTNTRRILTCAIALAEQKAFAGDIKIAGETYDKNLSLYRETFGFNHNGVVHALINAGKVYALLGNYDTAQLVYRDALAALGETPGAQELQKINILRGLAGITSAQHDEKKARQFLQLALDAAGRLECSEGGNITAGLYVDMAQMDLYNSEKKLALSDARRADTAIDRCMGAKHPLNAARVEAVAAVRSAAQG